ncbi:MAG TPA: L,D-transpeptidase [Longimicrobiales bacterium]
MKSMRWLLLVPLVAGCRVDDGDEDREAARTAMMEDGRVATAMATGSERLSPEELEAARMRMDWRQWVERDTTADAAAADTARPGVTETWDDLTTESVNRGPVALPVFGDVAGPGVLRIQILLDRARFSPGIIDGRWGSNTEKAVYWLQRREGLRPTGHVDEATWQRLQQVAGATGDLVRVRTLTQEDVAGPFVTLPEEYYDRRDMDCQCYESLAEKLAEAHHTSEEVLRKLNPGVDLNALRAGMTLNAPAVTPVPLEGAGQDTASGSAAPGSEAARSGITRIVISDGGGYLHALDASGRIVYHFPATLGSDYSPSPSGDFRITNIAHDPSWHYQPELLEGVDDDEPDAVLPAGPNNAVGVVWMQLSMPHYGIHGTSAPETIGYATSNGCVRLTNWDAAFLGRRVAAGTPVQFRDVN